LVIIIIIIINVLIMSDSKGCI